VLSASSASSAPGIGTAELVDSCLSSSEERGIAPKSPLLALLPLVFVVVRFRKA
jgi:hypothetical protein